MPRNWRATALNALRRRLPWEEAQSPPERRRTETDRSEAIYRALAGWVREFNPWAAVAEGSSGERRGGSVRCQQDGLRSFPASLPPLVAQCSRVDAAAAGGRFQAQLRIRGDKRRSRRCGTPRRRGATGWAPLDCRFRFYLPSQSKRSVWAFMARRLCFYSPTKKDEKGLIRVFLRAFGRQKPPSFMHIRSGCADLHVSVQ